MGTSFETETCSRCNGSGEYSHCADYGSKCFKCGGAKIVLTKRGAVAKAYFESLCTVRAESLKVGDRVATTGITLSGRRTYSYITTVVSVEYREDTSSSNFIGPRHRAMIVTTEHVKYGKVGHHVHADSKFRVYANDADKFLLALAYQATLTKQGTVKKRAKAA